MAVTYEPIATTTLGSASGTVTFSSIPGTYTDLVLVVNAKAVTTTDGSVSLRFNSDTGSNYSYTRLLGLGSGSLISGRGTSLSQMLVGIVANSNLSSTIVSVNNYSNSTTYKSVIGKSGKADSYVTADVGLWRSTAAITSISFIVNDGGNYATGSTFTIYGIKAA